MYKVLLALLLSLASISVYAGAVVVSVPPTTSPSTDTDKRAYLGLKWALSKNSKPEVVVGYRHARVKSNGDTHGGNVSLSFKLSNGITVGKFRTKYFNGQEDTQGEISLGYDFSHGLLVGTSLNAPYSNIGVDYLYSSDTKWQYYFMLNTLDKHDKPNQTLTCPNTFTLNSSTGQCDP